MLPALLLPRPRQVRSSVKPGAPRRWARSPIFSSTIPYNKDGTSGPPSASTRFHRALTSLHRASVCAFILLLADMCVREARRKFDHSTARRIALRALVRRAAVCPGQISVESVLARVARRPVHVSVNRGAPQRWARSSILFSVIPYKKDGTSGPPSASTRFHRKLNGFPYCAVFVHVLQMSTARKTKATEAPVKTSYKQQVLFRRAGPVVSFFLFTVGFLSAVCSRLQCNQSSTR